MALQHDDFLEDTRRATRKIADLATTSSQVEQRDMHHELQALTNFVKEPREHMLLDQSVKASELLKCRRALSDVQATQALTLISAHCNVDHKSSLQASLFIRNKHYFMAHRLRCSPFWTFPRLHEWNVGQRSSSITIQANYKNRFYIRNFCTNIIQQLRNAGIAIF